MSRSTKARQVAAMSTGSAHALATQPSAVPLPAGASGSFQRVTLEQADPHRARLLRLLDRMAGDVILRHVSGLRALDLGHGSDAVADWVEQTATTLQIVESEHLERALEFEDASFDVVYSLRTLPHVGEDEDSSVEAAQLLLRETGRVLAPGGIALIQIDNPRSLLGIYYGIRNPMTVVGAGSLVVEPGKGVTRFDTINRLQDLLPDSLELGTVHALRTFVTLPHLLSIPVIGRLLAWAEWIARDRPFLRGFGGHLLVVLRRLPGPATGSDS